MIIPNCKHRGKYISETHIECFSDHFVGPDFAIRPLTLCAKPCPFADVENLGKEVTSRIDSSFSKTIQKVMGRSKMKWAYGITTVPQRIDDLLPRTLESLSSAGFDNPRLFVDGEKNPTKYDQCGLEVTTRYPTVRTYGNWILTLWELYIRQPNAERYAIFQDDFVTYKNLRCYLEECPFPEHGYWNLYTFPDNQELAPEGTTGWYESNQWGRGAVALIFNKAGVKLLLGHQHMIDRPEDAHRGWKAVDGGVLTAMKKSDWKEYVHNPSLVQHTGTLSSMRNSPHKEAISFRGEEFNALELLAPIPGKGLGDRIERALTVVGMTSDRVSLWLGRSCGCAERKDKMNQIGRWVSRILSGKTEKAEQYLEEILEQ